MPKQWKTLAAEQASPDALWEITRNYTSYLIRAQDLTLSRDPLNLTGLNLKRDSGIANTRAIGIGINAHERKVREKRAKKKAKVVRFDFRIKTRKNLHKDRLVALKGVPTSNNTLYSERKRVTARAIVKTLQRDLLNYRADLLPIAIRRLRRLNKFKQANKNQNKAEAKKTKA